MCPTQPVERRAGWQRTVPWWEASGEPNSSSLNSELLSDQLLNALLLNAYPQSAPGSRQVVMSCLALLEEQSATAPAGTMPQELCDMAR